MEEKNKKKKVEETPQNEELQKEFEEAQAEFNEMTGDEEETPGKKKNYTIPIVIAAVLLVIGLIIGVSFEAKKYKKKTYGETLTTVEKEEKAKEEEKNLSDDKKELMGIKTEETKKEQIANEVIKKENEKKQTDAYKKYEKLDDKQKANQKVVPSKEKSNYNTIDEVKEEIKYDESGLPNKFNLLDKLKITVPNAKEYDLGWAFASIKTAETNYALNHNNTMPDYSEMHLDYFTSDDYYGYRTLHSGGNFYDFERYLSVNGGLVSESNFPYKETNDDTKVSYSDRDYYVTNTIYYPDYSYLFAEENGAEYAKDYAQAIKYHLNNFGSLYAVVMSPTPGAKYFNQKKNSLYFDGNYDENDEDTYYFNREAVTIIGYDDTYSKNNFNAALRPSIDGAYIAMVASGEGNYDKGLIYISYEDAVVTSDIHGVLNTNIEETFSLDSLFNDSIRDEIKKKLSFAIIEKDGKEYIPWYAFNIPVELDLSNLDLYDDDLDNLYMFNYIYKLDLSNNHLSDLRGISNSIIRVGELNLANNNISYIPSDLTAREINHINLEGNNISDVTNLRAFDLISLDISSDRYLYGFSNIDTLRSITIENSEANISELEGMHDLFYINLKDMDLSGREYSFDYLSSFTCDNCNISSLDGTFKFNSLYEFSIPNNKVTTLEGIDKMGKISEINLSNNQLTSINGIENVENLVNLNISNNPNIKDYSPLDKAFEENEYKTYEEITKEWDDAPNKDDLDIKYYYRDSNEYLDVSYNDISDISLFNNIDVYNLNLSGNKISDLSKFNNENIMEINLAYNEDLEGLENLKTVRGLNVSNTKLTNIDVLRDFKKLRWVNLANNDVKDITPLNKISNLGFVSLENNVNQTGNLKNGSLYSLNLANCELEDLSRYDLSNINSLNIANNKKLASSIADIKKSSQNYVSIMADGLEINYDDLYKPNEEEKTVYVYNGTLVYKASYDNGKVFLDNLELSRYLLTRITSGDLEIENGYIDRLGKTISVKDPGARNVTIKTYYGETYKIVFDIN